MSLAIYLYCRLINIGPKSRTVVDIRGARTREMNPMVDILVSLNFELKISA